MVNLLEDISVDQHLLVELNTSKTLEKGARQIDPARDLPRCVALIEHNLRKISAQLWDVFLIVTNVIKQQNYQLLDHHFNAVLRAIQNGSWNQGRTKKVKEGMATLFHGNTTSRPRTARREKDSTTVVSDGNVVTDLLRRPSRNGKIQNKQFMRSEEGPLSRNVTSVEATLELANTETKPA